MHEVTDPDSRKVVSVPEGWLRHRNCIEDGVACNSQQCPFRGGTEEPLHSRPDIEEAAELIEEYDRVRRRRKELKEQLEQERERQIVFDLKGALGLNRGGPRR